MKVYVTSSLGDKIPYNGQPDTEYDCDQTLFTCSFPGRGGFFDSPVTVVSPPPTGYKGLDAPPFLVTPDVGVYGRTVDLPVKSITIRIEVQFIPKLLFFNLYDWEGVPPPGGSPLTIRAEETAYLEPMDVVLLIDNSNSLNSPMHLEKADVIPSALKDPALFNEYAAHYYPAGVPACQALTKAALAIGGPVPPPPLPLGTNWVDPLNNGAVKDSATGKIVCMNKAYLYTRQCFGEVAFNIKSAAVRAYNELSASGTYRVGVVHTMSAAPEQAHIAVPLLTHPYKIDSTTVACDNETNREYYGSSQIVPSTCIAPDLLRDGYGISADPNAGNNGTPLYLEQPYGFRDYPSTRCAAMTKDRVLDPSLLEDEFPVPYHPYGRYYTQVGALTSLFGGSSTEIYYDLFTRDIAQPVGHIECHPGGQECINQNYGSSGRFGPQNFRFRPYTTGPESDTAPLPAFPAKLTPAAVIWMKNSGYVANHGMPLSKYNYTSVQLGILRAMDMLNNAPERKDLLPVRRKLILVFTDGVDDLNHDALKGDYAINPPFVTLKGLPGQPPFSVQLADPATGSPIVGPYFCEDPSPIPPLPQAYSIKVQTDINTTGGPDPKVLSGFNLGVFFYGFSGKYYNKDDTTSPVRNLMGLIDPHQDSLYFHSPSPVDPYVYLRRDCQSGPQAMRRGRFLTEHSTDFGIAIPVGGGDVAPSENPADYWKVLVPKVIRTLHYPVVVSEP